MNPRLFIDKILRMTIKLVMLTGVAFTMAACYGPYPPPEEPTWENEQQQLEKRLAEAAENAETE